MPILVYVCLRIRINYEQITNTFIFGAGHVAIKTKGAWINVYSSITLDCQTKAKRLFCEDCLVHKNCKVAR
jgi:hypothetical protein